MSARTPVLSVRGVVNRFGSQVVHDGVDLDVLPGEVLGIVGGSGTGKSVLLRTMLGLHRPNSGEVLIEGKDIATLSSEELSLAKRRYGVTFQHGALYSSLSVNDNVQLALREYYDLSNEALDTIARLKLRMVGLAADAGDKLPSQLSGGMIKRAALARALALDPALLFLDEPTAGLDPIAAAEFDELLLFLQKNLHLTVVMITHDLDTLITTCDRIAVLVDRRMIVDTLDGLMRNDHPWIKEYFHGPRARAAQTGAHKNHSGSGENHGT